MNALVVYESICGNTLAVAEGVAVGLGGAEVAPVSEGLRNRQLAWVAHRQLAPSPDVWLRRPTARRHLHV